MSETSFWTYLSKLLPRQGHYSRIETDTAHGFPDVHYTLDGVSGTIELKDTKAPRAKYPFSGKNGLRKTQQRWIQAEDDAGGIVLLALQCVDRVFILQAALYYDELHRMTLADIERVSILSFRKGQRTRPTLYAALHSA